MRVFRQFPAEVRGIALPRTPVNRSKVKEPGSRSPGPFVRCAWR
ncbi:MAG: hypothetical protein AVDCRST_MAG01-01-1001 [uncultured Rubrobacteraceae bacterium]|uniref:Uncharacterized protein n=1 Tax=uncultured Rubrobacteraceae bacterium TaxID=349277 RepID=A0A6J4NZ89_9ACTN|nr:MAG: hypothetical protein AVDCRST_MAG01-01-1001 [uncultured Rubrobacteraceae bacterium]